MRSTFRTTSWLKTIDYASSFKVTHEHLFSFKRIGGWLTDSLEVWVDGRRVLLTRVGYRKGDGSTLSAHSHVLMIDDHPIELMWKWNWLWTGNPAYIVLRHGPQILVKFGRASTIEKLKREIDASFEHSEDLLSVQLLEDVPTSDQLEEIAREEFPIDNRHGSEGVTVEHEVSRTLSSTLSVTNQRQIAAQLKAAVFSVVESQLSSHLERIINHTIGETLTRRERVAFSVKPGESVVYTIIWKARCRIGGCTLLANGARHPLLYAVRYGLSFEIRSGLNVSRP